MVSVGEFSLLLPSWLRGLEGASELEDLVGVVDLRRFFKGIGVKLREKGWPAGAPKGDRFVPYFHRRWVCDMDSWIYLQQFSNRSELYTVWQVVVFSYVKEVFFQDECARVGADAAAKLLREVQM